jgi:hypothetical protein
MHSTHVISLSQHETFIIMEATYYERDIMYVRIHEIPPHSY